MLKIMLGGTPPTMHTVALPENSNAQTLNLNPMPSRTQ